jgi:Bifunctional DNA primase/polymerase, N-terminal
MNERPRRLLDAAVRYADRLRWPVFPLVDKVPLTGSHGFHDATLDTFAIAKMFALRRVNGIGVATGAAGLFVVDLDGTEGVVAWRELAGRYRAMTDPAPVVRSPGGIDRFHIYYGAPTDDPRVRSTSRGTVGEMIETKAAGRYVAAPPSRHPAGGTYKWAHWVWPPPAPPEWLLELTKAPSAAPAGDRAELAPGEWATRYGAAALAGIVDEMAAASEGARNDTLHRLARRCGQLAAAGQLDEHVARTELVNVACSVGVVEREAMATWRSGFAFGVQHPARIGARR